MHALGTSISTENSASVCGINLAATTQCWGWNTDGQLCDGSVADSPVPVNVLSTHIVPSGCGRKPPSDPTQHSTHPEHAALVRTTAWAGRSRGLPEWAARTRQIGSRCIWTNASTPGSSHPNKTFIAAEAVSYGLADQVIISRH
jgi:hypothetical protein